MIHYEQVFFNSQSCFYLEKSRKAIKVRGSMKVKLLCFLVAIVFFNWKGSVSFNSSFVDPKEDADFIENSSSAFVQDDRLSSGNKAASRSIAYLEPLIGEDPLAWSFADSSPIVYYHILRIFSALNRMLIEKSVQVNHCTVLKDNENKTYENITSCFFRSFHPFKNRQKSILVQVQVEDTPAVDFNLIWHSPNAMNLVRWVFNSKNTANSFDITVMPPYTVSDVFEHLLNVPQLNEVNNSLQHLSELGMDRIKLEVKNHKRHYHVVHFELLRESTPLYDMEVLTDYSYGKTNFSIQPL